MTVLSAQSIVECVENYDMISPFTMEKVVHNGMSYGLSACSYDVRIGQNLQLGYDDFSLAHTLEDFCIPDNVVAFVKDKSSWARRGVSVFNTLIDPGFKGNLTLELANLGHGWIEIAEGDPICQIVFHWLDQETDRPYRGKYQNQEKKAQPFIYQE